MGRELGNVPVDKKREAGLGVRRKWDGKSATSPGGLVKKNRQLEGRKNTHSQSDLKRRK